MVMKHYGDEYEHVNMHKVVEDIIKPICSRTKMSYAWWKNCGALRPDALVTHCWDEPFSSFVQSIRAVFRTWHKKPSMFICAFALLQLDDEAAIADQIGDGLDDTPFVL